MAAIELINLSKSYTSQWGKKSIALNDLNLKIEDGEAFGFIGANGAGKSTTIKIIMGLLKASSGTALLYNQDVKTPTARNGIAYVPENPLLYDYLTPLEILKAGAQLHRLKTNDLHRHCLSWLERFDLLHVAKKQLRSFSKGMMQRTALAHAFTIQPKLMILDEPFSGLDPLGRKLVLDILAEYRQQGGTLFFSSHILYDVERLADRYALINKGKLETVHKPSELLNNETTVLITSSGEMHAMGMESQGLNRWKAEVSRANLWSLIEQLKQSGHQIHEIRSISTLEQTFIASIEAQKASYTTSQKSA
ncbi:ABC transporter ATP-binding protein [Deefgea tanakiae]|uniref:ABC transporter ATP-binding protein n=1 Tax=Deefgea tanakiae TaxID=2865840 RepID=A0ABX8Z710_9NEIS|nr:ABC transporter ATP-binding protein [Deefgea tanakiae]QZA76838.1 ABC transporter ATP-binding protein [Deefgea tanakiae]